MKGLRGHWPPGKGCWGIGYLVCGLVWYGVVGQWYGVAVQGISGYRGTRGDGWCQRHRGMEVLSVANGGLGRRWA